MQDGSIWRANLDCSNAQTVATQTNQPTAVAVNDTNLYWTTAGGARPGAGTVWRANLDGSNATPVFGGANNPTALALDSDHLYLGTSGDGTINQLDLDGQGGQVLYKNRGPILDITMRPAPAPALAFSAPNDDFGSVGVARTSTRAATLTNTGAQPSGNLTTALTGSSEYTIVDDLCNGKPPRAGRLMLALGAVGADRGRVTRRHALRDRPELGDQGE